jgi:hypothetical protein
MTLYFKINGEPVAWEGELIREYRYPRSIEILWTDAELAAIGLYRPLPADPIPDGKRATGESVQIVDGDVKVVLDLEDIPTPPPPSTDPADYPLSMRQLRLGLLQSGFPVTFIQDAITAIVWAEDDPRWQTIFPPDQPVTPEMIAAARAQQIAQQGAAQIWYDETSVVEWGHPMTQNLIAATGIDPAQAAAMWMQAKDLEA